MTSNGGCGGCGGSGGSGGAYRRDEIIIQQGEGIQAQLMEKDEYTANVVNGLDDEEAADLLTQMETKNLLFNEDGDLVSADGESDEAASRPSNSKGDGEEKQSKANIKIVRSETPGVKTLAMQVDMRQYVQPGLSADDEQMVDDGK
jgi:hypothetical protein